MAGEGWHPGVIGIVASRLRERYRKPVVVVGLDRAADIGKGSGRSQPGVNLGGAIHAAFDEGLLLAGGGHAMAAGLTVRPGASPKLRAFLSEAPGAGPKRPRRTPDAVDIDALVRPQRLGPGFCGEDFATWRPSGPAIPSPCSPWPMQARPAHGASRRPCPLHPHRRRRRPAEGRGLACRRQRNGAAPDGRRGALHVAGKLKPDDWNGRDGVELEIEDAADPRRARPA